MSARFSGERLSYLPPRVVFANHEPKLPVTWTAPADPDRAWIAYHEAAHVIVGELAGMNPVSASIVQDGNSAGRTEMSSQLGASESFEELMGKVFALTCARLAGHAAEFLWFGQPSPKILYAKRVLRGDIPVLTDLVEGAFERSEAERFVFEMTDRTACFLNRYVPRVTLARLARLLLDQGSITRRDITATVRPMHAALLLRPNKLEVEIWSARLKD